ncbi:hypothetical protein [Lichenihabitans psoromatis]|uniref:hypothetical protein n=1 Tax=Lichenihabitans psoromatis TaxID=2528642 RepID=UPI0010383106|nr:hypothetical protein [Lichenihabitans psoromatis]
MIVRLSKSERQAWNNRFSEWQTPSDMRSNVKALRAHLQARLMFEHGLTFWSEAYVAASFATLRSAERVRLIRSDRPDCEIELDGCISQFEITQADREDRQRGLEYRELQRRFDLGEKSISSEIPEAHWLTPQVVFKDLKRVAQKKADGRYKPDCGLVIYLLGHDWDDEEDPIENVMHDATAAAGAHFASVWVLNGSVLRELWRDGRTVPIKPLVLGRD